MNKYHNPNDFDMYEIAAYKKIKNTIPLIKAILRFFKNFG